MIRLLPMGRAARVLVFAIATVTGLLGGGVYAQPGASPFGQASAEEQKRQQDKETARLNQVNAIAALATHSRAEKVKLLNVLDGMTNAERLAYLNQSKQFQRLPEATKQEVIAQLAVIVPPPVPANQPPIARILVYPDNEEPNRNRFAPILDTATFKSDRYLQCPY